MIIDVIMPKMGESVNEGTVIRWYKKIGDKVKLDETIFEIATDKVDTEIPSPAEGVLTEILVNLQETVEVGTVVARIATEGEAVAVKQNASDEVKHGSDPVPAAKTGGGSTPQKEASKSTSSFFSPLVLNIAKAENISFEELENIAGTGIGGRVTKKDVLEYLSNRKDKTVADKTDLQTGQINSQNDLLNFVESFDQQSVSNNADVIPMDNIRQKIMHHMIKSRDTSVHVSAVVEVDMSKVAKFINLKKDDYIKKENIKLTYMPFIAQAAVKALKEYPLVNSSIEGANILQKKYVNLGIAVAVEPNGLIVPNIKNAEEKSLMGLAKSITAVADKARTKRLIPDDITGGTFTITNYGVFGSLFGTPIINQPEVAILGVGAVVKRAVVVELDGADTIAIKPMMFLTLAHDHRLVDGMLGGRFLKSIKDTLENYSAE